MDGSNAAHGFLHGLLAADPGSAALRADLAAALLGAGAVEAAFDQAQAALALAPDFLGALLTRAEAARRLHRHGEAIAALRRAVAVAPERAALWQALGAALAADDALEAAEAALARATALAPADAAIAASLGSARLRRGDFAGAEAACRRALARDPDCAEAHRNLAALLGESDPGAARAHRDAGFRARQVFVEEAARPALRVLALSAAGSGNVPLRHLFPPETVTLIRWYVEYAPDGQDRALPAFDLIFNAIGDADMAPALPPAPARLLADPPCAVLNPPARIARTARDAIPALLAGIEGVVVPELARLAPGELPALAPPLLLRPIGAHGGDGVRLVATGKVPAATVATYATRFVDTRDPDGFYRKYRVIFIAGVPYAYHLAIAPRWLVHYWTAGMEQDAARREEEARFLADPVAVLGRPAWAALEAVGARLGLDFAGIDFARLPDGRLLLFEANATMLVHPETAPMFQYRNAAVARIGAAFAEHCRGVLSLPR